MSDLSVEKKQRIEELVEQLNRASKVYYNGQDEIMSNYEWDAMFDELTVLEQETGYVLEQSPTQTVGYESTTGKKEQHEFAPLSLAKTKSVEELKKWADENKEKVERFWCLRTMTENLPKFLPVEAGIWEPILHI